MRLPKLLLSTLFLLLTFCSGLLSTAAAQAISVEPAPLPASEEPTLPEVLVQPPDQIDLPSTQTAAPAGTQDPYDLPVSYPNLDQLVFEGLGSALRSTRSVFDSPRATSIIDATDLEERQPQNMIDAIEREVGILVQRTGAGQVSPFIRGLTGPQTLLLIDGIRLNNSTFRFGPNQYFGTIDPGMVERIEIVRGPQSVLWGSDAIGGVINVVTKSAEPGFSDYVNGEFIERFRTADTSPYSRMNIEGSRNRLGVFTGASYLSVDNLNRGGSLGTQPLTDYRQYAGDIKMNYLLDTQNLLTVALQHNEQENVPRTDKWPSEERRFDPQQRDLSYVRWQADTDGWIDSFMLTFSFSRNKEAYWKRKPPTSTTEERGEFDVGTTGMDALANSELGWLGTLTYGVDLYHDDVDSRASRVNLNTGAGTPIIPQFPDDSYYARFGTFLQWEVDLSERLAATTGVRFSHIRTGATVELFDPNNPLDPPVPTKVTTHFQDWTASTGLTYKLAPGLNLVGSVSQGFRAPTLDELTAVSDNVNEGIDIPNPDLSPETSINYEVGLKFNLDRLRAQTFVFWTELDDMIVRDVVATIPDPSDPGSMIDLLQRRNIGKAEMQGYELACEYLYTPEWSFYGNLTYVYGQNVTDDEPLSRIPPIQGVVGLRWRDRQAQNWFELYGWLVAKQHRLSDRDERDSRIPEGGTPGYATVNVRCGSYISKNQRISLGIENIFDRAYRVHGSGVDGPGITGLVGYELFF